MPAKVSCAPESAKATATRGVVARTEARSTEIATRPSEQVEEPLS